MRNFLNIICEMPMTALHYDAEKNGSSFGKTDKALLNSEKGRMKIIRAFKKTPFNIEVFFLSNDHLNGDDTYQNDEVDRYGEEMKAGVHDSFPFDIPQHRGLPSIPAKDGVIRIVMLSNLSPIENKLPMTGWTLAHKIGHAIQDDEKNSDTSDWYKITKIINIQIDAICAKQNNIKTSGIDYGYEYPDWFAKLLTMKSARDNKLDNDFETFAELIAQYLIAGKITMNVDERVQTLVDELNNSVEQLLKSVVGKVLVEV